MDKNERWITKGFLSICLVLVFHLGESESFSFTLKRVFCVENQFCIGIMKRNSESEMKSLEVEGFR
ncbi:hypothetical protein SKA34_07918 [Photobacterium sp. SKA34]|nr:hypothetical protein SKA34_07918 [Photobacterium sp. SKA34]